MGRRNRIDFSAALAASNEEAKAVVTPITELLGDENENIQPDVTLEDKGDNHFSVDNATEINETLFQDNNEINNTYLEDEKHNIDLAMEEQITNEGSLCQLPIDYSIDDKESVKMTMLRLHENNYEFLKNRSKELAIPAKNYVNIIFKEFRMRIEQYGISIDDKILNEVKTYKLNKIQAPYRMEEEMIEWIKAASGVFHLSQTDFVNYVLYIERQRDSINKRKGKESKYSFLFNILDGDN